jgi:hypothetical protein
MPGAGVPVVGTGARVWIPRDLGRARASERGMSLVMRILFVEALAVGLSGVILAPVALMQALMGAWAGASHYMRTAAWGALVIVAFCYAANFLAV